MIVTDATETAAIVDAAGSGLVVPATIEGLANGIASVASASPAQLGQWAAAARQAAVANSWDARAERILDLLGITP
jgi:glycosyltransferase involved in cell wall biosynthesis